MLGCCFAALAFFVSFLWARESQVWLQNAAKTAEEKRSKNSTASTSEFVAMAQRAQSLGGIAGTLMKQYSRNALLLNEK